MFGTMFRIIVGQIFRIMFGIIFGIIFGQIFGIILGIMFCANSENQKCRTIPILFNKDK